MTIFGPDISSYQHGLDLSRLPDASFVIAKSTEGTYYTDADYQGWRRQAASLGRIFCWYHFLSTENADSQVSHTIANVGDRGLPGMLDVEPAGTSAPNLAQVLAYADAAHAAGLNLKLVYLPHWYWQQIGSPDLSPLTARGLSLVSSQYPGGSGGPTQLYPGDGAAGWQSYGGLTPLLYQYTDRASDGGMSLDYNAYRGTTGQLAATLSTAPPVTNPPPQENDMPAFATGEIRAGQDSVTIVCPPPANIGTAGWGNVWFSMGSDFGDAVVRVAAYLPTGWIVKDDVVVPSAGNRVNPFGGPLPDGVQKISIRRSTNPDVPLSWLVEATHR